MRRSRVSQIISTAANRSFFFFFCGFVCSPRPAQEGRPRRGRRLLAIYLFVTERSRNLYLNLRRINTAGGVFTFAGIVRKSSRVWTIGPFSRRRRFPP